MRNKKGFTLIELLAVIIVLAIIALIATPIVMNVIERSKKGAAERSAENYVKAVETQVMALRANGTTLSDGTYGIKSNGNICPDKTTTCNASEEIKIEMSGTKPSGESVAISNGKVTSTGTSIVVGDYTVALRANGSAVATKTESETPRYYSWGSGRISDGLPNDVSESVPSGKNVYLAFDSADGQAIDAAYVCFVKSGTPYCIQGGDSGAAFSANQGILDTVFPSVCSPDGGNYFCSSDGFDVTVYSNGGIQLSTNSMYCNLTETRSYGCGVVETSTEEDDTQEKT